MKSIVEITGVRKDYPLGHQVVTALQDINLSIFSGEFLALAGPSGSGKTTLLNLIGCIDTPTQGSVQIDGQPTETLSDSALTRLRLHKLGFIFQTFNLVPVLDVYQNVEFPLLLAGGLSATDREARVKEVVDRVGLTKQLRQRPYELSGGQRQRVAIARALVGKPAVVLADEPTANLDSVTGTAILTLMKELNQTLGTTFIFSTHDPKVIDLARRVVRISDGRITGIEQKEA